MSNPLVAQAQSQTTGVTGIGILESAQDLSNGVQDGSWVEGGLGALGVGLEVLSMVIDPLGTLAQYGVAWLIEHVRPLKEALDWLAGDPPVIQSFSDTWANVAAEVGTIAGDLKNEVDGGTAGWSGQAADTYRGSGAEQADALAGAASLADGISAGVMIMGTVVGFVREMVRDIVAELVGKLITWALEAACTLGFATPLIAAQATTAISSAVTRISDFIRKLVKTVGNVSPRISRIIEKLDEIIQKLGKIGRKLGGDGTTPSAARGGGGKVDTPDLNGPDTPGTPDGPDGVDGTPGGSRADGSDGTSPNRPDKPEDTSTPEQSRNTCNDPVDVVTGEMVLGQTDVRLAGALPLELRRVHVSSYRAGLSFGRSWACALDQRLEIDDAGVVYLSEDGMRLVYPHPGEESVVPRHGPRWPLSHGPAGYVIERPEAGRSLHFEPSGAGAVLTTIADRNGNHTGFERNAEGHVVSVRHSGGYHVDVDREGGRVVALRLRTGGPGIVLARYGYDERGDLIEVVNSSNLAMRFDYDDAGRIVRWVDRNGEWYRYFYDADGRCVANQGSGGFLDGTFTYDREQRITRFTDALGYSTVFHYNERNQLIAETDALGHRTSREWDAHNRLLSVTDPLGRTTRYSYDDSGNLASVVRPDGSAATAEYNALRLPVRIVEPDGAVWVNEFDERGNLLSRTDPAGAVVRYHRDERGSVRAKTRADGSVQRFATDAAGLVIGAEDERGARTVYHRDPLGRVAAVTDPSGATARYSWTVEGKLLSRTLPGGETERAVYDGEGNQVRYVDAAGRTSHTETTHFDLPKAEVLPDGTRVEFTYDPMLRLTAVTNAQGLTWTYEYDAVGRLVREQDFDGRVLRYAYDAADQLVEKVNGAGQVVRFDHDPLGNVVSVTSQEGAATYAYDAAGQMVRAVNADAEVVIERDPAGRVLRETVNGRTVESAYDAAGRRIGLRTPSGAETRWTYDSAGRPRTVRAGGREITFGYDLAGRETERVVDRGAVLAQEWDVNGRLAAQTLSAAGRPSPVQHRRYHYGPDSNLVAVTDSHTGTRHFALDAAGRVAGVRDQESVRQYAYDSAGNIASVSSSDNAETQGPRVYAGTALQQAGPLRYSYDGQGRVTLRQKKRLSAKPDVWRYSWDSHDRLVGLVTPDGSRWRYRYDALGRRIAKQRLAENGAVAEEVLFAWDGAALVEQTRSDGLSTTWTWQPGTFRPVAQVERLSQEQVDERFYAIVTDLVGTPTELVDERGAPVWRSRADVWGQALGRLTDTASTPLRFPGQYFDAESGLHYNLNRYYDPAAGRYQSPDPLGLRAGPNPYAYVLNPTRLSDPLGLVEVCDDALDEIFDRHGPEVTQGVEYQYRRMNDEMSLPPERRDHWIADIGDDPPAMADYFASYQGRMTHVDTETGASVAYDHGRGVLLVENAQMIHGYRVDPAKFDSGRYTARTS